MLAFPLLNADAEHKRQPCARSFTTLPLAPTGSGGYTQLERIRYLPCKRFLFLTWHGAA